MIDHRNLAGQELGRQIGPLHDALVHDLVLVLQVEPELERLDVLRGVEVDLLAVGAHQADAVGAVLQGEAGEAPLRRAGVERQTHALAVLIGQLLAVLHQLVPGRRRGVRIEAHLAEGVLVVVHDHRGALERDGVDAAINVGVQHKAVDEVIDERLSLRISGDQLVQRHGHLRIRHGEALRRQAHKQVRRVAALDGALDRGDGVVIVARVHGIHMDVRVLRVEVLRHRVNQRSRAAADVDREVHGQIERFRSRSHQAEHHDQGQESSYQFFHVQVSFSFIAILRPPSGSDYHRRDAKENFVFKIESFHFPFD